MSNMIYRKKKEMKCVLVSVDRLQACMEMHLVTNIVIRNNQSITILELRIFLQEFHLLHKKTLLLGRGNK